MALCALLAGAIAPAFGQWEQVPSGTTSYLKDIFFLNDSVGYCVGGGDVYGFPNGEQAVVLSSLDGGSTWSTVLQEAGVAFTELAAKGDTVVCCGRSMAVPSLLWTSFDNGLTWERDTLSVLGVQDLSFLGADLLFRSGQDLVRFDFDTRAAQTLFIPNTVDIYGRDREKLYLMTTQKSLHSSADHGLSWDTIPCLMADSLGPWSESYGETLFASGDTITVKLTYMDFIAYTTDHGENWTSFTTNMAGHVAFRSLDTLYAYIEGQQSGLINVSTDRGISGVQQQQLGTRVSKIFFQRGTNLGWACGDNGIIFKTTNGGFATGMPDWMAPPTPITVKPNPAHDGITLVVPSGTQVVSIALLDSSLKQVRHYHSSARVLSTQGLATGSYLLKIDTDQGTQNIKVMLQ